MKKSVLLTCGIAICFLHSQAQSVVKNDISAYSYSVNNVAHCYVVNATPSSPVEFYSERWGGKRLKEETSDATGMLQISERKFEPAFAIDKKTNKIFFMELPEFSIEKIELTKHGSLNRISWEASTNPDKEIIFEILKSKDGVKYETVENILAFKNEGKSTYNVTDANSDVYFYKINVINKKDGLRYSSQPMKLGAKEVMIYPSIVEGTLTIDVLTEHNDAGYSISNINGQVVKKGTLTKGTNTINVTEFASGSYIVTILGTTLNLSEKIVKQ